MRRAIDEGFYQPISPVLLPPPITQDRALADTAIADRVARLLEAGEHRTSVVLVRGGSIARLEQLRAVYDSAGVALELLHNRMPARDQNSVIARLNAGEIRAVGVVGMLGEGFDLSAIRIAAYPDKHRSLPATVQLIGRLARVDPRYPQPSFLVAVADADVFPELKGVVRMLYDEDADWAEVLPGVLDEEIRQQQIDRRFAEHFPSSIGEIDPVHIRPTKRAIVYEVPADWDPVFLANTPEALQTGASLVGGTVVYSGADAESRMLVVVVRYADRPRWSTDPALANVRYELNIAAYRRPRRTDLPGLILLNLDHEGRMGAFEKALGLEGVARYAGPERIGDCLDSLQRISVSSVGIRSTNAATRGRATYKNFLGGGVDRGLRTVDTARSALGHVMFPVVTGEGAGNAGGAIEKSKVWLHRYGELRELSEWIDEVAALLWFPKPTAQGPLLPRMDRGRRLDLTAPPKSKRLCMIRRLLRGARWHRLDAGIQQQMIPR